MRNVPPGIQAMVSVSGVTGRPPLGPARSLIWLSPRTALARLLRAVVPEALGAGRICIVPAHAGRGCGPGPGDGGRGRNEAKRGTGCDSAAPWPMIPAWPRPAAASGDNGRSADSHIAARADHGSSSSISCAARPSDGSAAVHDPDRYDLRPFAYLGIRGGIKWRSSYAHDRADRR